MKMVANLALVTIFVFMALVCYWQAPMLRKPSASLHPSHALRRGPRPLTAAGGQGPQDNTACDIIQIRFIPLKLPCACSWPPTSAGDQDPQDNTAFDRAHIRSCRLKPGGLEHPHSALTIPIRSWPSSTLPAIPPRYVCGSNSSIFRHGTIYHRTL